MSPCTKSLKLTKHQFLQEYFHLQRIQTGFPCRPRTEVRASRLHHPDRQHTCNGLGTMDIPNKGGYVCWLRICNFVLVLSTLLDGDHLNQVIYLNLVCWADLEHLHNLALSYQGFLSYLLQKTSKDGCFLTFSH